MRAAVAGSPRLRLGALRVLARLLPGSTPEAANATFGGVCSSLKRVVPAEGGMLGYFWHAVGSGLSLWEEPSQNSVGRLPAGDTNAVVYAIVSLLQTLSTSVMWAAELTPMIVGSMTALPSVVQSLVSTSNALDAVVIEGAAQPHQLDYSVQVQINSALAALALLGGMRHGVYVGSRVSVLTRAGSSISEELGTCLQINDENHTVTVALDSRLSPDTFLTVPTPRVRAERPAWSNRYSAYMCAIADAVLPPLAATLSVACESSLISAVSELMGSTKLVREKESDHPYPNGQHAVERFELPGAASMVSGFGLVNH